MFRFSTSLRLAFALSGTALIQPLQLCAAEAAAPAEVPKTVLIDAKKLLSAEDYQAVIAAASTYIEGDEMIYIVEVLGADVVRIKLGTVKRGGNALHGIRFMLRRTSKGWRQDQRDPASIWME